MNHSNIIQFYKFFSNEIKGSFAIVMEFFPSVELKTHLKTTKITQEVKEILVNQIIDTLKYLHINNIVHKDLNITNVLINPEDNKIKIIDFGLSQIISLKECFTQVEGNNKYRPPSRLNCDPESADHFGCSLICISILINKSLSTKKACKLHIAQETMKLSLDLVSLLFLIEKINLNI